MSDAHPEPVDGISWVEEEIQQIDYLLWSHGASPALRARIRAEMCGDQPPKWAVDASSIGRDRWDGALQASGLRKQADRAWGRDAQLAKAAEEFAELAAALNRLQNDQQPRNGLLSEFVDARIMLWQIALLFSPEEMAQALDAALAELEERLEVHG